MKAIVVPLALLVVSCAPNAGSKSAIMVTHSQSGNPGPRIAAYCVKQSGKKVGNGECWTLANEAFISAGARRPGSDMRVWGRVVNPARESLMPGDIIEFESARFSDGIITGSAHTAVVVTGGSQERFSVAEQNWGKKTVRIREMDLTKRVSGKVIVYRPQ
ncbi:MAG: hypothetical protein V4689_16025 [Verrucomicrobiota bacterium]